MQGRIKKGHKGCRTRMMQDYRYAGNRHEALDTAGNRQEALDTAGNRQEALDTAGNR